MKGIIKVERLSKCYRIGLKEKRKDTILGQIGQVINSPINKFRQLRSLSRFGKEDESVFWALSDINFELKRGEVLGIIGHNGAGKSTLLKILSRITEPTEGKITVNGRIGALLEVGTGFHPELTGRDNIYMNGTILGMTRKEIDIKLDEILDFSGVEKYIDTPVKFYSSGMKVRLGFAVAAHLEPEILIIDEVLAVGDAEFQKKCLSKLGDASKSKERTIIFVSHNLVAVKAICTKSILMESGRLKKIGETSAVVDSYLDNFNQIRMEFNSNKELAIIKKIKVKNEKIFYDKSFSVHLEIDSSYIKPKNDAIEIFVKTNEDLILFTSILEINQKKSFYEFIVPEYTLNVGRYKLTVGISNNFNSWKDFIEDAVCIEVEEYNRNIAYLGKWEGLVRPKIEWRVYND